MSKRLDFLRGGLNCITSRSCLGRVFPAEFCRPDFTSLILPSEFDCLTLPSEFRRSIHFLLASPGIIQGMKGRRDISRKLNDNRNSPSVIAVQSYLPVTFCLVSFLDLAGFRISLFFPGKGGFKIHNARKHVHLANTFTPHTRKLNTISQKTSQQYGFCRGF